jgi:hypothetical protein
MGVWLEEMRAWRKDTRDEARTVFYKDPGKDGRLEGDIGRARKASLE